MYSTNQQKLQEWSERHGLRDYQIAVWWECSPSYIRRLLKKEGGGPGVKFAKDVPRCMRENVPKEFQDVTFDFADWYDNV